MNSLQFIAEIKIRQALEAGQLDNVPGHGCPLVLEDDSHVPEDLRMAYKVLRNAGFVPPEVSDLNEAQSIAELLDACPDSMEEGEKLRQMRKLEILSQRIAARRRSPLAVDEQSPYYARVLARVNKAFMPCS